MLLKHEVLQKNGTYNKNFTKVKEQRFINDDFYDPRDLVQVKYEMLRAARETERSIDDIVGNYGFSRSGFYKIKSSFEKEGVSAFVPNKTGPQNARKLTKEHQQFIDSYLMDNPGTSSDSMAVILKVERGLEVSKRTIERYRRRQGKYYQRSQ